MAHWIEKTEFDIYRQTVTSTVQSVKEYRHNLPAERQRMMQEVEIAWQTVESMGKPLDKPVLVDAKATSDALNQLKAHALDGYDVFALQAALASGVNNFLTRGRRHLSDLRLGPAEGHRTAA